MESLSRSSHRRKHSTTAANVFSSSFSFKNPYGDVLLSGGAERNSLQLHEYSEIFSGSSSIPVLDLSAMDERVGPADCRSSKLDYTNIFSGFTNDDVFVPYEELINGSAKRARPRIPAEGRPYVQESGSRHRSRKTERPPGVESDHSVDRVKLQESGSLPSAVKMERPSDVASDQSVDRVKLQDSGTLPSKVKMERPSDLASDPSFDGRKLQESGSLHPSRKTEMPSGVASDQSIDGIEQQFNMSFNRTNQINTDAADAKTHIAELHAVPGFTQFVDGSLPHKGNIDRPPLIKREVSRTWSFSTEVEPVNARDGSSSEKSGVHDKSHNVNGVNLKSPLPKPPMPSSYPTNRSDKKETRQLRASYFASKGDVSQKTGGESPEDLEDNSVDAVSAAALQKAIEQAQESIRIAKIIMERKRDGYQDGSKNNSTRKKYEVLNLAGIDGKSTSSLSQSGTYFHAESSEGERVSGNIETDREPGEKFAGGTKVFASNHNLRSETAAVDENVNSEKHEKNVEADEVQRVGKYVPGRGAVDLEPVKAGNFRSLVPPISELASNLGRLVPDTFKWRDLKVNLLKRSEAVPKLVEGASHTSERTQGTEKSWEEDELCQDTFVHAEGPENNEGSILSSSQRIHEHASALVFSVDEASENLRIFPEDGVNEQRENDSDDKKQHEQKLEECDEMANARSEANDMLNESCNPVRNESLDQQEMDRKTESVSEWEGDDQRHAETYNEEIWEAGQNEDHLLFDDKEQMQEAFLEVINAGKPDVFPEVGEIKIEVDEAHQPEIDDNKQDFADNLDEPKLPEQLVHDQVEEKHVNTFKYEAVRTNMMEARLRSCREAEKTGNTNSGAGRGEGKEAEYEEDINEAVNLSSREASVIVDMARTDGTSNVIAETQESCHVESNSKVEVQQKPVKDSEGDVPKSDGAVSTFHGDKMEEGSESFSLLEDGIHRTNFLHRSASEEIFVENKLHDAYLGFPSETRTEAVNVADADPKENLSQDEDVSETTSDIEDAAPEYAAEIPQVLESHLKKVELDFPDVEQVLEQTAESDEGSLSDSSFEKIDKLSAQKSEECAENVKGTASNKEGDDIYSDESKGAEKLSEGLYSQLHDEPQEMDKPLATEEAVDTDVNVENYKENLVGTSSLEEIDAKEGIQNIESNDQQQRIEAIKRGREREKDRVAVERAIREARERAFAEVRERAERAAVERAATEVRQRVMAEARQKVEKPPVVKQPLDKASTEAKVRAERAAVERATAEARERALEKAKSLKTSGELKTPADKHSTERFSSSSRNSVLKHSFSSSDLESGMDTESAQRRKARLERHQRIMERAAKALAEKNMRDLLAQKEQAERNRLAESLDADIKRWASGKEGNLRALLSTLQYILGPESGWQSISLTEIITTAAVKKAYRKATLCVHPDKLQQRGASVQQKYICEKVFDLLKAAWNRFNSDER